MTSGPYENVTIERLLIAWNGAIQEIEVQADKLKRIEAVVQRKMTEAKATVHPHDHLDVRIITPITYDREKLSTLFAVIPRVDLVKAGAFTPEHMTFPAPAKVPDAWDLRKVKPFLKRGEAVQKVFTALQIKGAPQLTIKPKAKKGAGKNGK